EEGEMRRLAVMQAEQEAAHHGGAGARDAGDERRALPQADDERLLPAHRREQALAALATQALGGEQHDAVDDEERRRDDGGAEQAPQELLEGEAQHRRRNGGDDDEPQEPPLGAPLLERADAEERQREAQPVAPEIRQQRRRRAQMQHHQERQEGRGMLVDVPADQLRQDHGMPQAAHLEELGDALQEGDDEGLESGHSGLMPGGGWGGAHHSERRRAGHAGESAQRSRRDRAADAHLTLPLLRSGPLPLAASRGEGLRQPRRKTSVCQPPMAMRRRKVRPCARCAASTDASWRDSRPESTAVPPGLSVRARSLAMSISGRARMLARTRSNGPARRRSRSR